jgi:hypothetical protein
MPYPAERQGFQEMAHIIKGDRIIVHDGTKYFLAECWSATLSGDVKTYKRSGVSYDHKLSSREQVVTIEPKYVSAAQLLLCYERERNVYVDYKTMDDLLAALEKEAERERRLSSK